MKTEYALSGNRVLRIEQDASPLDPRREFDHPDVMVCFHRRYELGDKGHGYNFANYESFEDMAEVIQSREKPLMILPVYLYDHSGISISTGAFSCPWDSGQVGFIWITEESLTKICGDDIEYRAPEYLKEIIDASVKEYNQYLSGEIYGFTINKIETCSLGHEHESHEDSCWGFYGSDIEANGILDHLNEKDRRIVRRILHPRRRKAS